MTKVTPVSRSARKGNLWLILGGVFGAAVLLRVIGATVPQTTPSPEDLERVAEEKRANARLTIRMLGEQMVRASLKDPQSAQFTDDTGRVKQGSQVACGRVNARNSFGAFAGNVFWIAMPQLGSVVVQSEGNSTHFLKLWNRYCSGRPDDDPTPPAALLGVSWGSRPSATLKPFDASRTVWIYPGVKAYLGVPIFQAYFMSQDGRIFGGSVTAKGRAAYGQFKTALLQNYGTPTTTRDEVGYSAWDWGKGSSLIQLSYNPTRDETEVHEQRQ